MMHLSALLVLLPVVLGCSNPDSNVCASYIKSNRAVASPFCATLTKSTVTATTGLPAWASNCAYKPSQLSKECSCYWTGTGAATATATSTTLKTTTTKTTTATTKPTTVTTKPTITTTKPGTTSTTAGSGTTRTGLTTVLPQSSGAVATAVAITISGSFDGGMKKYDRSPAVCQGQTETGEADAIFVLEDGATLSNVIIGPGQAEGVHCKGTCTVNNVWWEDVCEDAITFKQPSGTSYINGGGAFSASDKVIQFNGFGTVSVKNFYVKDYGKVSRSCGNCSGNGGARNLIFTNVVAVNGGVLCGINTNYGDTCTITDSCQNAGKTCDRYTGNNSGAEPPKIGSGFDGTYCKGSITTNC